VFLAGAAATLLIVVLVALGTGAVDLSLRAILAIVASLFGVPLPSDVSVNDATVLLAIRLPRVVLGVAAGAGLSAAGAALQAMFRNPLADPMLIGVSSGAALAVTATIVVAAGALHAAGPFALPLAGFAGGLATTVLLYRLATFQGATSLATMLLAGIAINALAFAGIGLLTTLATNEALRSIAFWNFGSLAGAGWPSVAVVVGAVGASIAVLTRLAPGLNALAFGEREARHLGFATEALKRATIALAALMAGVVVATCGVIGFIALVSPHIARVLGGADNRIVVPGAALVGASLLVAGDVVGRSLLAPAELPIGIVSAFVGAPFFLWLLVRRRGEPM
jgi:iron complex transport system permease protein